MLKVDTANRPKEGWHESPSGAVTYVTHVGGSTHIECFDPAEATPESRARLAALSAEKARQAFTVPVLQAPHMQRL